MQFSRRKIRWKVYQIQGCHTAHKAIQKVYNKDNIRKYRLSIWATVHHNWDTHTNYYFTHYTFFHYGSSFLDNLVVPRRCTYLSWATLCKNCPQKEKKVFENTQHTGWAAFIKGRHLLTRHPVVIIGHTHCYPTCMLAHCGCQTCLPTDMYDMSQKIASLAAGLSWLRQSSKTQGQHQYKSQNTAEAGHWF